MYHSITRATAMATIFDNIIDLILNQAWWFPSMMEIQGGGSKMADPRWPPFGMMTYVVITSRDIS